MLPCSGSKCGGRILQLSFVFAIRRQQRYMSLTNLAKRAKATSMLQLIDYWRTAKTFPVNLTYLKQR